MTALLALPLALVAPAAAQAASPADAAFDRLKTLVGTWRPADRAASALRIRFALTAGGTVLSETWERAGKPHSLTLYHRDGSRLIATHYCPQGNQPRLALTGAPADLRFAFVDATDLAAEESYLRALSFDLADPAQMVRRETYRQGTTDEASTLILVRDVDRGSVER